MEKQAGPEANFHSVYVLAWPAVYCLFVFSFIWSFTVYKGFRNEVGQVGLHSRRNR